MTTRQELADAEVTLDGQRAKILGTSNDFATVRSLEDHARSGEWSWETVERIIAVNGGAFSTMAPECQPHSAAAPRPAADEAEIGCTLEIFHQGGVERAGDVGWWMTLSGELFGPYDTDDQAIDAIPANLRSTFG